MALLALSDGVAEIAFAVADHMHHLGIATLLLEHLVSYARSHQITFGPAAAADSSPAGHAARLTPLTDLDADQLIPGVAPGRTYLRDLLLRVSRLADDLPEVTGLDLSPVIACPDGAIIMAARITVAPYEPYDPFLRKLR